MAHNDQLSADAVVLCLHGFTRAGVLSASLHGALWMQLAGMKWRQLVPKQIALALWSASASRQQPGAMHVDRGFDARTMLLIVREWM